MNDRLDSVPYTKEDWVIWWIVTRIFWCQPGVGILVDLEPQARASDRRDADLMLFQMRLSTRLKPAANYIRWMDLYPDDQWSYIEATIKG